MATLSVMMVLEVLEVLEVVEVVVDVTGGESCEGDRGREFLGSNLLADFAAILRWEAR